MKKPESSKSQREGSRNFCDGRAGDSGFRIGREEVGSENISQPELPIVLEAYYPRGGSPSGSDRSFLDLIS